LLIENAGNPGHSHAIDGVEIEYHLYDLYLFFRSWDQNHAVVLNALSLSVSQNLFSRPIKTDQLASETKTSHASLPKT